MKTAELIKKYQKFVSNIEWHIKTNKPPEEVVLREQWRIECYSEIINDLQAMQSCASQPSPVMSAEQVDYGYYYPLFKFFSDEHGLTLLDSQLQDVIHECKKFIEPTSPSVKADGFKEQWHKMESEIQKHMDEWDEGARLRAGQATIDLSKIIINS